MAHDRMPGESRIRAVMRPRMATRSLGAVVALGGLFGLPVTGLAEAPAADDASAVLQETVGPTRDARLPGRHSTVESGDWDGLVGLVIEYLEPAGDLGAATARTDGTPATPST
jgi:hypothetical protein